MALEQTRIRGNEIAGDQLDDIAGNQLANRNRDRLAVTSDGRLHGHRRTQGGHRILRPNVLDKIEDDAQQHDDDDDDESGDATRERGHAGRYQEDDHQRVLKTNEELAPKRHGFHVRRVVFAIACKPGLNSALQYASITWLTDTSVVGDRSTSGTTEVPCSAVVTEWPSAARPSTTTAIFAAGYTLCSQPISIISWSSAALRHLSMNARNASEGRQSGGLGMRGFACRAGQREREARSLN